MPNLVLLAIEPLFNLLEFEFFVAVGQTTNFGEWLESFVIHNELHEFLVQLLSVLQDLVASLNEFFNVEVLCQLPRDLLFLFVLVLADEDNIVQLVDVVAELFELNDLVVEVLLEIFLDLLDLLLHFLLVVLDVDNFAEYLILLLLVDILQLLEAVTHGSKACFDIEELFRVCESYFARGLDLLLQLIELFDRHVLSQVRIILITNVTPLPGGDCFDSFEDVLEFFSKSKLVDVDQVLLAQLNYECLLHEGPSLQVGRLRFGIS